MRSFTISPQEKKLLSKEKPWGIILFKRNIKSLNQVKKLIIKIRKITKDSKFPIMIDEEGKTVSRLSEIINHSLTQKFFGDLYNSHPKLSIAIYKNYIDNLCNLLNDIGVNINTVPLLDVLRKKTNKIIGERSFSNKVYIVKELGKVCINKYNANKIATVIKHVPGHGCSRLDSHLELPKINLSYSELNKIDFEPFKFSKSKFAMTAHILYEKLTVLM